jgi:hypothetical protein
MLPLLLLLLLLLLRRLLLLRCFSRCCRCEVIKGGMEQYLTPMGPTKLHVNPIFEISPLEPRYSGEHSILGLIIGIYAIVRLVSVSPGRDIGCVAGAVV